jgi:hypothetical protein
MIQYNEPDAEIKELWSKAHSNYYVFAQLLVERMNKKALSDEQLTELWKAARTYLAYGRMIEQVHKISD